MERYAMRKFEVVKNSGVAVVLEGALDGKWKARSDADGSPDRAIRLLRVADHELEVRGSLLAFANKSIVGPDAFGDVAIWQDE